MIERPTARGIERVAKRETVKFLNGVGAFGAICRNVYAASGAVASSRASHNALVMMSLL